MVLLQLDMTNVSLPTECPKNTPSRLDTVVSVPHCVRTVRHASSFAESVVELKVVHHRPDVVIGQVYR